MSSNNSKQEWMINNNINNRLNIGIEVELEGGTRPLTPFP